MDELLSDLLKLFRVGRVVKQSEEVDLCQLAQESIQSLEALIRSKNITVKVSLDLPIV